MYTPHERLATLRRTGRIYPATDSSIILLAEPVGAPVEAAAGLGIAIGATVIQRVRVAYHRNEPISVSTSWLPGDLATAVPELVERWPIPGGTVGKVSEVTGRKVVADRYRLQARGATSMEAGVFSLVRGAPVMTGENWWYEADGTVLEFGQFAHGPGVWVDVPTGGSRWLAGHSRKDMPGEPPQNDAAE